GGVATATWAPPAPSLAVETEFPEQYAYEVLIFDADGDRRLGAAGEIVSPANKDRPDSRQPVVAQGRNLLAKGGGGPARGLGGARTFNLDVDLRALLRRRDPAFDPAPPPTYAATCRKKSAGGKTRLEAWSFPLVIGQPLPTLPIWLAEDLPISLDLEASYEETCRALRIG